MSNAPPKAIEIIVPRCYDSHVHWLAVGEFEHKLDLTGLTSESDVAKFRTTTRGVRQGWRLGYGWDQNKWPGNQMPTRQTLDESFPREIPICFSRADGHAVWMNTEGLKRAGFLNGDAKATPRANEDPTGGRIERDEHGNPAGVLVDVAMEQALAVLPPTTDRQILEDLTFGAHYFHRAGFSHIRDLSCTRKQFEAALELEANGKLDLAVTQNFDALDPALYTQALQDARWASKINSELIRVSAVKVFYDGALGSEGAYLSQEYACCNPTRLGRPNRGLRLLDPAHLKEIMREVWSHNLDIAVHAIGDQAAHEVVATACELWDSGSTGTLHIEHAQLVRPDTLKLMKGRPIHCHMQPCHWLSDKLWLDKKIPDLKQHLFRWAELEEFGIAIDFGSDAPIEKASLHQNYLALEDAALNGIRMPKHEFWKYQMHSDASWTTDTYSKFTAEGKLIALTFQGRAIRTVST